MDREGGALKQVSLITLGCKVNSFDTTVLWEGLEKRGFAVSDRMEAADVYVINTCTVTNSAGSQSRQVIRKVRRLNPDSLVVVTGCYAQVSPDEVSGMEGVDFVVGNGERGRILDIIEKRGRERKERIHVGDIASVEGMDEPLLTGFRRKSRAFLKVQDGCEAFCTYCIIPYARGRSRSLPVEDVEKQVRSLASRGYGEIVLTGIHLGGYGFDLPDRGSLLALIRRLDAMDVEARFRISSVEPTEISDEMIEFLVSSRKMCRHLHIPLQSGDAGVLEMMGRGYSPAYYRKKVEKIVSEWEGVAIGVDVIAGFPGEDRKAFMNSYNLLKELPVAYLHVFPYSKRDGTPAAEMEGHVDPQEIKERCAVLRELGMEKKEAFCRRFLGKRLEAVKVEEKNGSMKTLSDNYIDVMINGKKEATGPLFEVEIDEIDGLQCYGRVVVRGSL